MRTNGNPKRLIRTHMIDLEPVPVTGSPTDEDRLQTWMDQHPDLLPIAAFSASRRADFSVIK